MTGDSHNSNREENDTHRPTLYADRLILFIYYFSFNWKCGDHCRQPRISQLRNPSVSSHFYFTKFFPIIDRLLQQFGPRRIHVGRLRECINSISAQFRYTVTQSRLYGVGYYHTWIIPVVLVIRVRELDGLWTELSISIVLSCFTFPFFIISYIFRFRFVSVIWKEVHYKKTVFW